MNYCQSCRRHLNGAVSCPGCGAVDATSPEMQAPHAANWMTEIAWPERDPLPAAESHAAARASADGGSRARTHGADAAKSPQVAPRPTPRGEDQPGEREPLHADKSAADPPNGRDDRRPRKRRGLGLGVTVTGAIAGIIIVGLLILGNLPTAGDSDAPVGAIATVSRSTPHATGTNSGTGAPTLAGNDSSAAAHSNPSTTSASPSSSTSSPPTSASTAPAQSATSTQAEQPTSPSTTTSSAHSSPTATQSTTSPASPSPSPSQSQTHVSCILIICW